MGKRPRPALRPSPAAPASIPAPPGLARRLGALLYDSLLLLGILFFATLALLPFRGTAFGPHSLAYQAYLLLATFLFFGGFWTHGGQTLGMRAWKIKLCAAAGGPVSWRQAGVRFASALLSFGLLGLGFFAALADPEKRCWHDRLAGTRMARQD
jgi:uncharacterized RDD family membrane protein YckC